MLNPVSNSGQDRRSSGLISRLMMLLALLQTSLAWPNGAMGAEYFVDSETGDDLNSGLHSSPDQIGGGPWRSLKRLSIAAFQPGDVIRLKCGQVWREGLELSASGSTDAPITLTSFPESCAEKPLIDGSLPIAGIEWERAENRVWKTAWPANLVVNGALATGYFRPWSSWSDRGTETLSVGDLCGDGIPRCLVLEKSANSNHALAISNRFRVSKENAVRVSFLARLPSGQSARVTVRRHGAPFIPVGLTEEILGTGNWSQYSFTFLPTADLDNARLDFELKGGNTKVEIANVAAVPPAVTPLSIFVDDVRHVTARHPNPGDFPPTKNAYFKINGDSAKVPGLSGLVSDEITFGPDMVLPAGSSAVGGDVLVRTRAWVIDKSLVESVSSSKIKLAGKTTYDVLADWGFILSGRSWMVDFPAEWAWSEESRQLIVRTYDDRPPGYRASISVVPAGISLANRADIVVSNIAVTRAGVGVDIRRSQRITLDRLALTDTAGSAVEFAGSSSARILQSTIRSSGEDALNGTQAGTKEAQFATIFRNDIRGSGVDENPARGLWPPRNAQAAINAGQDATVSENRILRTSYSGIRLGRRSAIHANVVEQTCLVLDDCAGIYVRQNDNGSVISDNLVIASFGNTDGKPSATSHAVGIYLDDWTSGVLVTGNHVIDADHGIQVHNAFDNEIVSNVLFGSRVRQLWMQEDRNLYTPTGDITGNIVRDNLLVPIQPVPAVRLDSNFGAPFKFSAYEGNIYSTLLSPIVVEESWLDSNLLWQSAAHTIETWRSRPLAATGHENDSSGRVIAPSNFAQYKVTGVNSIRSARVANDYEGWRTWNAAYDGSIRSLECPSTWGCFQLNGGTTPTLVSSPRFEVSLGTWYRVSFDERTINPGEKISVIVRRGGAIGEANAFQSVMGPSSLVEGAGSWRRHAFVFRATRTVRIDDPQTGDIGARLDFGTLSPGQSFDIRNVEIRPISAVEESTKLRAIINRSAFAKSFECPAESISNGECSNYVIADTGAAVSWPLEIAPRNAAILFTQDPALVDSDRDGIADAQDMCPSTAESSIVNGDGCGTE